MNVDIEPRKEKRFHLSELLPHLPYFTPRGWLVLTAIFAVCFAAGVAFAQWAWAAL